MSFFVVRLLFISVNNINVMDDLSDMFCAEQSPLKYFTDDIFSGHSLRSTTPPGNDQERERIYDTIFRLPWRCELVNLHVLGHLLERNLMPF